MLFYSSLFCLQMLLVSNFTLLDFVLQIVQVVYGIFSVFLLLLKPSQLFLLILRGPQVMLLINFDHFYSLSLLLQFHVLFLLRLQLSVLLVVILVKLGFLGFSLLSLCLDLFSFSCPYNLLHFLLFGDIFLGQSKPFSFLRCNLFSSNFNLTLLLMN